MEDREQTISRWFDMWLTKKDTGIPAVFAPGVVYTESWGPEYHGVLKVKLWFEEWNRRGTVEQWDIKSFFHRGNRSVVEWYFKCSYKNGEADAFEGMSLVEWTDDGKIVRLKEFGCNEDRYDPYENGQTPQFRDEKAKWF